VVAVDALDPASHQAVIDDVVERHGDLDLAMIAFGVLGDQAEFDEDPVAAADAARANYVGAVSSGLCLARRIRTQGHGTIVVLSSVAGIRPRSSNFVYGSTKAGLDAFAQGLGDHLVGTGGRVMVVRPGFVHTRMTEGMDAQPFATDPDTVATAIVTGLEKGSEVVWAPGLLRYVFAVMRVLPRPVWRIVSAR
jgi:decaprenylphospho-beta-D-erythro-pentofuranosid-2-ulose 2-reductase